VVEYGKARDLFQSEKLSRVFDTPVSCIDGPNGPLAVYY
jgi:iron complex transport system ATP-binding protein